MTQHIEWADASYLTVTLDSPGSEDHPALDADDTTTAGTHYALAFWADSGYVIETEDLDALQALSDRIAVLVSDARERANRPGGR